MVTTVETLSNIRSDITLSVVPSTDPNVANYYVQDITTFYNAVEAHSRLSVAEDDVNFIEYLDLKVLIGQILANLKDKPSTSTPIGLRNYNFDRNTLDIVKDIFGSYDFMQEFYLINGVNSDFEMISIGKMLVPEGNF